MSDAKNPIKNLDLTMVINQTRDTRMQGHHQEFFRAGKVSWNKGNLINVSFATHERKAPQGKMLPLKQLKTAF